MFLVLPLQMVECGSVECPACFLLGPNGIPLNLFHISNNLFYILLIIQMFNILQCSQLLPWHLFIAFNPCYIRIDSSMVNTTDIDNISLDMKVGNTWTFFWNSFLLGRICEVGAFIIWKTITLYFYLTFHTCHGNPFIFL